MRQFRDGDAGAEDSFRLGLGDECAGRDLLAPLALTSSVSRPVGKVAVTISVGATVSARASVPPPQPPSAPPSAARASAASAARPSRGRARCSWREEDVDPVVGRVEGAGREDERAAVGVDAVGVVEFAGAVSGVLVAPGQEVPWPLAE